MRLPKLDRDAAGEDAGFTLIEVMIAVVLLGVVMGALGMAALVFVKNMTEVQARLFVSNSRSFTSRYIVGDLQSAAVYEDNGDALTAGSVPASVNVADMPTAAVDPEPTPPTTCPTTAATVATINGYGIYPGASAHATLDRLFRIEYAIIDPDLDGDGTGDGDCQLLRQRFEWDNASPPTMQPVETITVAHDLLVDGNPPVVFAQPDLAASKWQVTVRLKPKSSQVVQYDYSVWAKQRVEEILP